MDSNKHIHVTCAIIEQDGFVLAVQRSASMSLPLKWEFPGGKINHGESSVECLKRELLEELAIHVCIERILPTATHQYPSFTVTLYPFICRIDRGSIVMHAHSAAAWLLPDELHSLDWAEADIPVITTYLKETGKQLT